MAYIAYAVLFGKIVFFKWRGIIPIGIGIASNSEEMRT
jgi:hypothetical protein